MASCFEGDKKLSFTSPKRVIRKVPEVPVI